MNYKKIILVGCISAFVAGLTSIMGVAGTIIGSVISSVLYNMLTEALEKPVGQATFSTDFEWEIAYIFPIVVIALIQLLLIFALLSEMGFLPYTFLSVFLSIQNFADNNLYKLLGMALIVMSVYPLVLKPDIIKKSNGAIIAFVGIIFLARGFVDVENRITDLYDAVFAYFDLPIAIIAFILLVFVIYSILVSARNSENEYKLIKHSINESNFEKSNLNKVHHSKKHDDFDYEAKSHDMKSNLKKINKSRHNVEKGSEVTFKNHIDQKSGINQSSGNIQFESNDLLDDYKK
ncbi:MAG: hypothetical protein IKH29_09090 [Methanobrevibacter sp.]|uniref:hypothetical protein n=1 Tax=Methanobrevibacter sp. TaxID=66852 RepID=UPI0025CDEAE2|nr:hypothetical protein [Methanobrevibacter sp.]MBR3112188.1 hypothetical protein [Methanobrevibacter sp.]MBR3113842.1 hypothetical protein [Methanobrevibacter sp.]